MYVKTWDMFNVDVACYECERLFWFRLDDDEKALWSFYTGEKLKQTSFQY